MNLIEISLVLVSLAAGDPKVTLQAPDVHVKGEPFSVKLVVEAPADGGTVEGWKLTAAGFQVDGKPLAAQGSEAAVELGAGEKKTVELDLASMLPASGEFELVWGSLPAEKVRVLEPAPKDVKFMDEAAVPAADLTKYWVLLRTNRGGIVTEFWPDVAPNHVRNFLDLASTGFYDGVIFHRVSPGFMIQGGDPTGKGTGDGPRRLKAEFSDKKHEPGVLSMARSPDPNSASCQFFIMHAKYPSLDGQYSVFGKVVTGMETVDRIANAPGKPIPGAGGNRPNDPQVIERAIVVMAPSDAGTWQDAKAAK